MCRMRPHTPEGLDRQCCHRSSSGLGEEARCPQVLRLWSIIGWGSGEEFLHLSGAEDGERGAWGLSLGSGKVLHPGPRVPGTPSLRREALPRDGVGIQLFSVPPACEVKGTLSLRPVV